jgi:hypothetical protein
MLKALRLVVRPLRLFGRDGCHCTPTRNMAFADRASTAACIRVGRCSSSLLTGGVKAQHYVRWNSSGPSNDAAHSVSSRQEEMSNHNVTDDDGDDDVVYPCFSDLEDLHFISKERLSRAGLERMTEIQFKTWGPVLEGRGTLDLMPVCTTYTTKTLTERPPSYMNFY